MLSCLSSAWGVHPIGSSIRSEQVRSCRVESAPDCETCILAWMFHVTDIFREVACCQTDILNALFSIFERQGQRAIFPSPGINRIWTSWNPLYCEGTQHHEC